MPSVRATAGPLLSQAACDGIVHYSDGQTESFAYDKNGNMVLHEKFDGSLIAYAYDPLNRQTARDYPNDPDETLEYSVGGELLRATDAHGVMTYEYDAHGHLSRVNHPTDESILYEYDEAGNLSRTEIRVTSTGALVSATDYDYDRLNRLETVSASPGVWSHEYNEVGLRTAVVNPNGTRTDYAWDGRNRLSRLTTVNTLTSALINDFDYELDDKGNRLAITDHADGSRFDYAYDEVDRLVSEIRTGAADAYSRAFTLDAVGNRLTQVTTGHLTDNASYSYDANDRLQSVTDGPKVVTYAWDANGNQTEETDSLTGVTRGFVWNDRDRLAAVFDDGAHVASYGYDHGANRVSREAGGVITRFLVDLNNLTGYSQVARETDAPAGATPGDPPTGPFAETVRYTYGDDLLAQIRADVLPTADPVSFYHYDGLGSVRALTDSLAGVANAYAYEAFGNLLASTPASAAPINVYLYTGERLDAETGLYHLRARQRHARTGSFMSIDPISGQRVNPLSLNKYIYVWGSPLLYVDPSGERRGAVVAILIAAAVGSLVALKNSRSSVAAKQKASSAVWDKEMASINTAIAHVQLFPDGSIPPEVAAIKVLTTYDMGDGRKLLPSESLDDETYGRCIVMLRRADEWKKKGEYGIANDWMTLYNALCAPERKWPVVLVGRKKR